MRAFFTIILIAASVQYAWADGLKDLQAFMGGVRSGQARFTQTVTAPPRDGQAQAPKKSSGSFAFERPGRFRFVYEKPFAQTIVADGKTLWLYDEDLNQVSARAQGQALASTPAALLASAPDMAALGAAYQLERAPDADGLQWVLATPRAADGQLKSVRVGFAGGVLAALDITDGFGQRSQIRFLDMQANPALARTLFEFKVPAGADVLRQ